MISKGKNHGDLFVAQAESSGLACHLRKSQYGLKHSLMTWFGRFSTIVKQLACLKSGANYSIFYPHSTTRYIYLVVYIDDIDIIGDDHNQLKQHITLKQKIMVDFVAS